MKRREEKKGRELDLEISTITSVWMLPLLIMTLIVWSGPSSVKGSHVPLGFSSSNVNLMIEALRVDPLLYAIKMELPTGETASIVTPVSPPASGSKAKGEIQKS